MSKELNLHEPHEHAYVLIEPYCKADLRNVCVFCGLDERIEKETSGIFVPLSVLERLMAYFSKKTLPSDDMQADLIQYDLLQLFIPPIQILTKRLKDDQNADSERKSEG